MLRGPKREKRPDINKDSLTGLTRVQLVGIQSTNFSIKPGSMVIVTGTLLEAQTGSQFTSIVIVVADIQLAAKE